MGLTRLGWRGGCAILILTLIPAAKVGAVRPEYVLADVLAKPFAPREWASPECIRDSAIYLKKLEKYTPWALQMYDASVKIPVGLITGNYKQLGNFDECLSVKSDHEFIGQACYAAVQFEITANNTGPRDLDLGDLLVNVAIASNLSTWTSGESVVYEWMWCVPSTCNHAEIQEALEIALDPLKVEGRVDMVINVPKESCHTVKTVRATWDIVDYCYISILILYALVITTSTSYDIARRRHLNQRGIFTSFSLYTNGKNLLKTDRRPESIRCLDGLRYLSICWIIFGHTYYMEAVSIKMNLTQVPLMHHDWSNMLILNGNIVTDTFFLLSGILLAYTELLKKEKDINWRFNMLGLYLHRYLRLTPAYAMMIGFYATLFHKFGMGPHWDTWVGSNRNFCRESWWTNLLYINNYVNVPSMCMSQSWYLSIDMQLVWLSPLILYPMLKFRRLFFAIIFGIGLLLSVLVPFVVTYTFKLTGTMLYYKEQMDVIQVYLEVYTKVYNRFGPYIIGLGLGYLLHKTRFYNIKLRTWCVICGWTVAIAAGLSVVFGPRGMYFDTYVYNRLEASLYAGFHRPVFALAVSWIIFCCVHGYAGPVNHFLSWRGWIPFSKLSYCAYLSHYVFLLSDVGSVRTVGILTPMNVVRAFFANLAFTMILSALWTLCFEMPFITIDRALLSRRKQESSKHKKHRTIQFGEEVYRSRDELSATYDSENPNQQISVTRHNSVKNLVGAKENGESGAGDINDETELSSREVYIIDATDFDNTWSGVNTDNGKSGYVNADFYHNFRENEGSRMNPDEKETK